MTMCVAYEFVVLGMEGAFYALCAQIFISERPTKRGQTGSKKPPGPGHEATRHRLEKHL